jgi:enterobactin synthetase component D
VVVSDAQLGVSVADATSLTTHSRIGANVSMSRAGMTTMPNDSQPPVVEIDDLRAALNVPATLGLFAGRTGELGNLGMPLPEAIRRASKKRQLEFAAGRYCASRALRYAGYEQEVELRVGEDKLPDWPPGWTGSISHCNSVTIAMAGQTSAHASLGVDVEEWVDMHVASNIQSEIGLPGEIALFQHLPLHRALTVLFSAKEALYKALYPLVRQFFDFKAVQVIGVSESTLTLRLCIDLGERWPAGSELVVRYALFPHHVYAMLCL